MIKKIIILFLFYLLTIFRKKFFCRDSNIYNKIDLFGEVLEKINKEYVEDVDQSKSYGRCNKWFVAIS